ncbi:hypothetical protein HRI_002031000 [Hibiscus trionum]|uniref:Uncharacterized protein n=1 Tax=Hibiscus trionum TaxID=183268 RepID=A0A9W7M2J2_HIBTR|nr:hypothetical protein HRI_002030600 [Hibiscus trionum]GMI83615.1 hypothetical protein HRI_002030800 [Hibiscus trionum]GMI83617.1 hypothetical protein HRI_002031000 [Hibiscus trionum]
MSESFRSPSSSAAKKRGPTTTDLYKLEMKVAELRVKRANLLKKHTDICQKVINKVIENRVLKANVETLESKVKMRKELFESVFGFSFDSIEISTMLSSIHGSLSNTSTDAAVSGTNNELSDTCSDENI